LRLTALENGERDRPGRPAGRPAQQLPPGVARATRSRKLSGRLADRSAAVGNAPAAAAPQSKRPHPSYARPIRPNSARGDDRRGRGNVNQADFAPEKGGARPSRSPCCASRTAAFSRNVAGTRPSDCKRNAAPKAFGAAAASPMRRMRARDLPEYRPSVGPPL